MMVVKGEEKDKDRVGVLRRRWGGKKERSEKKKNTTLWERENPLGWERSPPMEWETLMGHHFFSGASIATPARVFKIHTSFLFMRIE